VDARERQDELADRLVRFQHRLHHWAVSAVQANRGGLDLSLRQVAVLYMIRNGAAYPSRIARKLRVTPAVVTGLLDRLEQRGYVRRTADPNDRRRFHVALTDAGEAAADAVMRMLSREVADCLAGASAADLDLIERALGLLERMTDALEQGTPTLEPVVTDGDDAWQADPTAAEAHPLAVAAG
jgi:DNA-binding MarR family transcriptional regulator